MYIKLILKKYTYNIKPVKDFEIKWWSLKRPLC